jgi:hypothetical protein
VGLLAHGVDGHQRGVVVHHVVAPHQPRRVGQPVGVRAGGRAQQQQRRVHRAAGDDVGLGGHGLALPFALDFDADDAFAAQVGQHAQRFGARPQRDAGFPAPGARSRRPPRPWPAPGRGSRRRSCSGCSARPRAGRCPWADGTDAARWRAAVRPARRWPARAARPGRVRRERGGSVGSSPGSPWTVDFLGAAVVGLQVVVADGPGWRCPAFMLERAEILPAQAGQRGAVDFGVAAHEVMDARLEGLAVGAVPGLVRLVALLVEDDLRLPVLRLLRQIVPALDEEDAQPAVAQRIGQRAAARARADDDEVECVSHAITPELRVARGELRGATPSSR